MVTLLDHVDNLSRHTTDTKKEILQSILRSPFIIDEDTLMGYYISYDPWGISITVAWMDGDGKKIKKWIEQVCDKYKCTKIYGISTRWKAIARKYKCKPVGMLLEIDREAF